MLRLNRHISNNDEPEDKETAEKRRKAEVRGVKAEIKRVRLEVKKKNAAAKQYHYGALRRIGVMVYAIRPLGDAFGRRHLEAQLFTNGLPNSGTNEELLDRIAECTVLGVPPLCPTCSKARLRWAWDEGFSCPGFFDGDAALSAGTLVSLRGLEAKPELNGLTGTCRERLADGRWTVELDADHRIVSVKLQSTSEPRQVRPCKGPEAGAVLERTPWRKLKD